MSDASEDSLLAFLGFVIFILFIVAVLASIAHFAIRLGWPISAETLVLVIEYALLMIVLTLITGFLYIWDVPTLSIFDLEADDSNLSWDEDDDGDEVDP